MDVRTGRSPQVSASGGGVHRHGRALRPAFVLLTIAALVTLPVTSPASGRVPQIDFDACKGTAVPPEVQAAPHTDADPTLPRAAVITVPTSQPDDGVYQQADIQVGEQMVEMVLDTGSSWMVLNANAVADNAQIKPTGLTAAVTYGGGATCAAGPVVTAPVSIGGRRAKKVTFLLAESGDFPFVGILGINTWQPPASALDVTLEALEIDQYQLTLPSTADPQANGTWVLNDQPDIDRANPRRVAVFDNRALAGGNRVEVPGTMTSAGSADGAFMLDIGTPQNIITVFPRLARELGYDFSTEQWDDPDQPVRIEVAPNDSPPFSLQSSTTSTETGDMFTLSAKQVATPYSGVTGLAGTSAIIGADYVRNWVMGVRVTPRRGIVRLLALDRQPADLSRCGDSVIPDQLKRDGRTRLVGPSCRVNGSRVEVRVDGSPPHDVIERRNGSVWLRTYGADGRLTVTWRAAAYVYNNGLRVDKRYRM